MMHTAKYMHQILDLSLPAFDELFDDVNLDDNEAMSRHNTMPRGTNRYYMQESAPNVRRMSPRRQYQNYDS